MTALLTVEEAAAALRDPIKVLADLREQGWSEAAIEVTRGGTYRVTVKAEGDKVARPAFGTGRK